MSDYNHPEWRAKRIKVLNKLGNKCAVCGDRKNLDVHHKSYKPDKELWDYPLENFEILCKEHHRERHGRELEIKVCAEPSCKVKIEPQFTHCYEHHMENKVESKASKSSNNVIIFAILAITVVAVSAFFLSSKETQSPVNPSRPQEVASTQDKYSGHIVCKGKEEGEKCNGGVLVKNDSRGGFYGCENFNNGKGCRYTIDYPFICKGCKKYMVKRPKGRVTKNGKPVLIWGCPDYLETRAEKCEEYWDYK